MSLTQAAMGESVLVVRVSADGSIRRRLQDLGITTGAELTPLSCTTRVSPSTTSLRALSPLPNAPRSPCNNGRAFWAFLFAVRLAVANGN